ncbi:ATP synthase F0 subunit B [Streptococcus chenjunshii]|uniref:ATP synthase subunit b n=1 Tax=Streptococcus chenjunshii TaxID=2173853 RepID=A0A372KJT5_9STRE|nr:F0F1 ATP synthase subunit B [Streptococcus chenjunshii]AXQ78359.1 ATP synthase F0 subunit B [Streptococcus chenjunshii]RFU50322.1 ATP synthase F0 subunit B [Streptococcus chenjunshii]RFU52527.1 ATP synthase F0 subunit B [Streptococcus chenjunshii]
MEILINSTTIGNIIIITGSVLLLLVLIRKYVWGQLTGIFKTREEKIANDIDSAEAARQKAEDLADKREHELVQAKGEASQIIDDAKELSTAKGNQIIAAAEEEAGRLKVKANQDIAQNKAEALSDVKGEVADLTVLLAEKIMTANLDKEAQSHLIDSYLDELGEV